MALWQHGSRRWARVAKATTQGVEYPVAAGGRGDPLATLAGHQTALRARPGSGGAPLGGGGSPRWNSVEGPGRAWKGDSVPWQALKGPRAREREGGRRRGGPPSTKGS